MASLNCLKNNQAVEIEADLFLVGRNPSAHFVLLDPTCSRSHFQISRDNGQFWLHVAPDKPTFLNGVSISNRTPLIDGDRIAVGDTRLVFENPAQRGRATELATSDSGPNRTQIPVSAFTPIVLPVGMKVVLGRNPDLASRQLDCIQVSQMHAEITRSPSLATIKDLHSSNGTFVNGQRIRAPQVLTIGDRIDIGRFSFEFLGDRLEVPASAVTVELACLDLTRSARKAKTSILKDVGLSVRPGEFVCILGPSGAGKSTLLRALSNREDRNAEVSGSGRVLLSGSSLFEEFSCLKHKIAVVPQHEILFDNLRLSKSLYYTAKLRLPTDTSSHEIYGRIDDVLGKVQLSDRRDWIIGDLSGGERKRAALATEILAEPNLLFLDEVTSGLDDLTDSDMMRLFRQIADDGKAVICVTHTLACVPRDCDLVIALTKFGRLAFVGKPDEATEYFGVSQLTGVYGALAVEDEESAEQLRQRFLATELARTYLIDRLNPWRTANTEFISAARSSPKHDVNLEQKISQFSVLSRRYLRLLRSDQNANLVRVLQCLLVALLMCAVFGDVSNNEPRQVHCVFLVVLSCYWFGCNNAAKELVKERNVFAQERDVSVNVVSYLASKTGPLSLLGTIQALILVCIVRLGTSLPGDTVPWCVLVTIVAVAGASAGLAISAWSSSEEVAIGFVPIWIIPQIILSGAIVPLDGVNLAMARLIISSFWGVESAKGILMVNGNEFGWRPIAILIAQASIAMTVALTKLARRN